MITMSKQKTIFLLILVMLFLECQCKTLVSYEGYELEKQNGKTVCEYLLIFLAKSSFLKKSLQQVGIFFALNFFPCDFLLIKKVGN